MSTVIVLYYQKNVFHNASLSNPTEEKIETKLRYLLIKLKVD